jgi:O-antigen/teichoic acid export membrane protein
MDASQKHIRGSSVLVGGRVLGSAINFLSQVLMVRHLSTTDYGHWAYALSVVSVCSVFATLGFDKAIDRFIPIYQERKQYEKLFGTVFFVAAMILIASSLIVALFYAVPGPLSHFIPKNGSMGILLILVFLIPFEAIDHLLVTLFASFADPRAILFRKHMLGPVMKLLAVVLLVACRADVIFLAYGYLAASITSMIICGAILLRILHREGLLEKKSLRQIEFPIRKVVFFTLPLISSELVAALFTGSNALFVGYFHGPEEVALYRVVVPMAALNYLVRHSFSMLYTPHAARLFVNGDHTGIRRLYWQSTVWMVVLSFPILAVTLGAAESVVLLLYGERYAASGKLLAILAVGTFFQVALGFSNLTLRAIGKVRQIFVVDLLGMFTFLGLNLLLIPHYGALGAAIGESGSLILYTFYRYFALSKVAGIQLFGKEQFAFYSVLAGFMLALTFVQFLLPPSIYIAVPLVSIISLRFLMMTRKYLQISETFPELRRVAILKWASYDSR